MSIFFLGINGSSNKIMNIQPSPLLQIAALQVSERLNKQQWPLDFLANELDKLPSNLKDRLRILFLNHRNLPQDVAKVEQAIRMSPVKMTVALSRNSLTNLATLCYENPQCIGCI